MRVRPTAGEAGLLGRRERVKVAHCRAASRPERFAGEIAPSPQAAPAGVSCTPWLGKIGAYQLHYVLIFTFATLYIFFICCAFIVHKVFTVRGVMRFVADASILCGLQDGLLHTWREGNGDKIACWIEIVLA